MCDLEWEDVASALQSIDSFEQLRHAVEAPEEFCEQTKQTLIVSAGKRLIRKCRPKFEPYFREYSIKWEDVKPALANMDSVEDIQRAIEDPKEFCSRVLAMVQTGRSLFADTADDAAEVVAQQGGRGLLSKGSPKSKKVVPYQKSNSVFNGEYKEKQVREPPSKILILDQSEIGNTDERHTDENSDAEGVLQLKKENRFWKKHGYCVTQMQLGCCSKKKTKRKDEPMILTLEEAEIMGYRATEFNDHSSLGEPGELKKEQTYARIYWEEWHERAVSVEDERATSGEDEDFNVGKANQQKIAALGRLFLKADVGGGEDEDEEDAPDGKLSYSELEAAIAEEDKNKVRRMPLAPHPRYYEPTNTFRCLLVPVSYHSPSSLPVPLSLLAT
jgi:hypothetical protein